MCGSVRSILAVIAAVALFLYVGEPARADQAPFWESPTGLVPGNPNIQVRMASEDVDIEIVERGEAIHALVRASFTMVNDGETATVKVGFPASTTSMFDSLAEPGPDGVRHAESPGLFTAQHIQSIDVTVDGQPLPNWRQDVQAAADAGYGSEWAMWEMTFPAGETTTVMVTYDQVLTDRASDVYVQPMYVLRTGALWHGNIGEATVTLHTEAGGGFVGGPELYWRLEDDGSVRTYPRADQVYRPADAAEISATRLFWHFRDLEPTRDVGATYVRSSAWRTYAEADRAILQGGSASADALRQAADAALAILGGPTACPWDEARICVNGRNGTPFGLVERLAGPARERARRAVQLAPDDPAALQTYGDMEYWFAMPTKKHHGELACWPSQALDAYERAQALGVGGAEARLASVRLGAHGDRYIASPPLTTCSGEPDARMEVELVKATVEQGNTAWATGIGARGTTDFYPLFFAGPWLEERAAEVEQLRSNRQTRRATLQALEFTRIVVRDDLTATVETDETWEDLTLAENGQLVRDVSGRLRQRYELQKVDGFWKIVGGEVVRGEA